MGGTGTISHVFLQYPPVRCDIPKALGVTYDDANKLLIVPTPSEIFSWPITSTSANPDVTRVKEGPFLGVRFSLDRKILAIQRSDTEVEFVNKESCASFRQSCKNGTDHILGMFWTDCPTCDVVFITTSGLELYSLYLGRNGLKFVEAKRLDICWYVYTHESRLALLASGVQCKTLSGFQFSAGGIVRLPKFEAIMTKSESNRRIVLASDAVHIATMYGRLYCLQLDRASMVLHLYRFYRDAVVPQGSLPTYAHNVAVSIVDNILIIHQIDSKVALLYDILSDSKVPISAPLPLQLRGLPSRTVTNSSSSSSEETNELEGAGKVTLYEDGWVFISPDIILDHGHGLLWKLNLDLEAVAASSSDVPSLIAFLQRRRQDGAKAKKLSLSVMRSAIIERRPLRTIATAFDILTAAYAQSIHSSSPSTSLRGQNSYITAPFHPAFSVGFSTTPGIQSALLADVESAGLGNGPSNGSCSASDKAIEKLGTSTSVDNSRLDRTMAKSFQKGNDLDVERNGLVHLSPSEKNDSTEPLPEPGLQVSRGCSPVVSPKEVYEEVFLVVEELMAVDAQSLVAVIVEYIHSSGAEKLRIPHAIYTLIVQLLAREKCFSQLQRLIASKVLEPSKQLALQILEVGRQHPLVHLSGMDMLRKVRAHNNYIAFLLQDGHLIEALRYMRQNKVEMPPSTFLEAAVATNDFQMMASVLRFCRDFYANFDQTSDYRLYYSILQRNSSLAQ